MNNSPKPALEHNSDQSESVVWAWLGALINPFFLFQGLSEAAISWLFTRPWKRLCLLLPGIAVVALVVGLIVVGSQIDRQTLRQRYARWAEEESKQLNATTADKGTDGPDQSTGEADGNLAKQTPIDKQLFQPDKTSAYGDILFRRLMRLDDEDPRTKYAVALQLARSGRKTQARQMMKEVAPAGTRGFAPAHAWLAVDLLSRGKLDAAERRQLMQHLRETVNWERVSGHLLMLYANLLAEDGKRPDALAVMEKAAQKQPELLVNLAVMAKQFNAPKIANESSSRAKTLLQQKLKSGTETIDDIIELVKVQLIDDELNAALATGRVGLAKDPGNEELKYLCSQALRLMYRQSIRKTDEGTEINLSLLDAAIKEFPSNPYLAEDIALLSDLGAEASKELKAALEEQLAKGQATAVAHLMLANQEIKAGRLKQSLPHLEQSLKLAPSHPVTLNNLALVLALTDAKQLQRAEDLADKAVSIAPNNAEFHDTQGEIRLIADRPLDAIESLEKAIGLDPERRRTHELLAKAYRIAGSEDMAAVHEKFLAAKPVSKSDSKRPVTDEEEHTPVPASSTSADDTDSPRGGD